MITLTKISKKVGPRLLFENINVSYQRRQPLRTHRTQWLGQINSDENHDGP